MHFIKMLKVEKGFFLLAVVVAQIWGRAHILPKCDRIIEKVGEKFGGMGKYTYLCRRQKSVCDCKAMLLIKENISFDAHEKLMTVMGRALKIES